MTTKDLSEEGKWLLELMSFRAANSVFNITDENNSFSFSIPGCWRILNFFDKLRERVFDKLENLLKLRSQNDFQLHIEEVLKKGVKIKLKSKQFSVSDFDTSKKETLQELKRGN